MRQQQCTLHRVRIRRMPRARRRSVRTGSCTHVQASGSGELLLDPAMPPYCIILTCCIVYICGCIPCHVHRARTRAYKHDLRRGQPQPRPRRSCLGRALQLLPWQPSIRRRLGCLPRPNPTPSHRKQHRPPRPDGACLQYRNRPDGRAPWHAGACTGLDAGLACRATNPPPTRHPPGCGLRRTRRAGGSGQDTEGGCRD